MSTKDENIDNLLKILGVLLMVAIILFLYPVFAMLAWNEVFSASFGIVEISYWQAFFLNLGVRSLFGFWKGKAK